MFHYVSDTVISPGNTLKSHSLIALKHLQNIRFLPEIAVYVWRVTDVNLSLTRWFVGCVDIFLGQNPPAGTSSVQDVNVHVLLQGTQLDALGVCSPVTLNV